MGASADAGRELGESEQVGTRKQILIDRFHLMP